MTYINKNTADFPIGGFFGKIVKAIIPQRDPQLDAKKAIAIAHRLSGGFIGE